MKALLANSGGIESVRDAILFSVCFALCILLLIYIVPKVFGYFRSRREDWSEISVMPKELQSATLFLNEQEIATEVPVPYHGVVDQVFRTRRGRLIIVDTKSRPDCEYYKSDIYQMSVYRFILARQFGKRVSMYGYVRVSQGDYDPNVTYIPVRLLSDSAMIHLWQEYNDIRNGLYKADCTCDGRFHG